MFAVQMCSLGSRTIYAGHNEGGLEPIHIDDDRRDNNEEVKGMNCFKIEIKL